MYWPEGYGQLTDVSSDSRRLQIDTLANSMRLFNISFEFIIQFRSENNNSMSWERISEKDISVCFQIMDPIIRKIFFARAAMLIESYKVSHTLWSVCSQNVLFDLKMVAR